MTETESTTTTKIAVGEIVKDAARERIVEVMSIEGERLEVIEIGSTTREHLHTTAVRPITITIDEHGETSIT